MQYWNQIMRRLSGVSWTVAMFLRAWQPIVESLNASKIAPESLCRCKTLFFPGSSFLGNQNLCGDNLCNKKSQDGIIMCHCSATLCMNGGSTEEHNQSWHSGPDEATGKWLCFSVVPWMGQPLIKVHTPRPRPNAWSENTLCCTTTTHWSRSSDGFQTHTLTCSLGSGFFPKSGIISPTGRIHPCTVTTNFVFVLHYVITHRWSCDRVCKNGGSSKKLSSCVVLISQDSEAVCVDSEDHQSVQIYVNP